VSIEPGHVDIRLTYPSALLLMELLSKTSIPSTAGASSIRVFADLCESIERVARTLTERNGNQSTEGVLDHATSGKTSI